MTAREFLRLCDLWTSWAVRACIAVAWIAAAVVVALVVTAITGGW